jgi:HlyD family secretion protein
VQRYESALYLPVQCVVRVAGEPTVYVKTVAGLEARAVKIGLDNNRMVHILEGLAEGDPVVLNPPLGQGNAVKDPEVPDVKIPDAPPADGGQRPGRGERPKRGPANGKQPPSRRG